MCTVIKNKVKDGKIGYKVVRIFKSKNIVRSAVYDEYMWRKGNNLVWSKKDFKKIIVSINPRSQYNGYFHAFANIKYARRVQCNMSDGIFKYAIIKVVMSKDCHSANMGLDKNIPGFCSKKAYWDGEFIS